MIFDICVKEMKKLMVTVVSCVWVSLAVGAPSQQGIPKQNIQYKQVIIFGDSLSDSQMSPYESGQIYGNNEWLLSDETTHMPLTGAPVTNLRQLDSSKERSIWINMVISQLYNQQKIIDDHVIPYRIFLSNPEKYKKQNINFAFASAETGIHYLNDLSTAAYPPYDDEACKSFGAIDAKTSCVPGVLKQIEYYKSAMTHMADPDQTLFFIWAGGNDMFNNIAKLLNHYSNDYKSVYHRLDVFYATGKLSEEDNKLDLSHPISNLKMAVNELKAMHVPLDHIYVFTLPDLSITPAARKMAGDPSSIKGKLILSVVKAISYAYNLDLRMTLALDGMSSSHIIPVASMFHTILDQEKAKNMDITDSCADKATGLTTCEDYAFYDEKHPTYTSEQYFVNQLMPYLQ